MDGHPLAAAPRLVEQLFALLDTAVEHDPLSALAVLEGLARRTERAVVNALAAAERSRMFEERGYRSTTLGVQDLLGWEPETAHRRVKIARDVVGRIGLDGSPLPPRLPATAAVFTAGDTTLRHVETIARLLGSRQADRVSVADRETIEAALAQAATTMCPREVRILGRQLLELADTDGEEPRDEPGANRLAILRNGDGTGSLSGVFADPVAFDTIVTALDARTAPTAENAGIPSAERAAAALVELCTFALTHDDEAPQAGGQRPHVTVTVTLAELEGRARGALLDHGGSVSPAQLRQLLCDCHLLPIVLDGHGAPIDVGRTRRTIPTRLRRAVAARDRGCAHPGCDRPPSWCHIHHIREWQHGGRTDLDNLVMLCAHHHRQIHATAWRVEMRKGRPAFLPPDWLTAFRVPGDGIPPTGGPSTGGSAAGIPRTHLGDWRPTPDPDPADPGPADPGPVGLDSPGGNPPGIAPAHADAASARCRPIPTQPTRSGQARVTPAHAG